MDLNLQPLAPACVVSGDQFSAGERVASFLVRSTQTGEIVRYDMKEAAAATFAPSGPVACRWVKLFKPRGGDEHPERTMKLTAENLFVTLADPATDPSPDNIRLVQFLALLLASTKKSSSPHGNASGQGLWRATSLVALSPASWVFKTTTCKPFTHGSNRCSLACVKKLHRPSPAR